MPEFILDHGSAEGLKQFDALDAFTQGYIEAMFFTETGTGDDAEDDLEHASFAELAPETLERIRRDCADFQEGNANHLGAFKEITGRPIDHAGHDFWLTRNGHGAGFWDRGAGRIGDTLSSACKIYGGVDLYRGDDGLLYLT